MYSQIVKSVDGEDTPKLREENPAVRAGMIRTFREVPVKAQILVV
jgi:hypothetical protein